MLIAKLVRILLLVESLVKWLLLESLSHWLALLITKLSLGELLAGHISRILSLHLSRELSWHLLLLPHSLVLKSLLAVWLLELTLHWLAHLGLSGLVELPRHWLAHLRLPHHWVHLSRDRLAHLWLVKLSGDGLPVLRLTWDWLIELIRHRLSELRIINLSLNRLIILSWNRLTNLRLHWDWSKLSCSWLANQLQICIECSCRFPFVI